MVVLVYSVGIQVFGNIYVDVYVGFVCLCLSVQWIDKVVYIFVFVGVLCFGLQIFGFVYCFGSSVGYGYSVVSWVKIVCFIGQ